MRVTERKCARREKREREREGEGERAPGGGGVEKMKCKRQELRAVGRGRSWPLIHTQGYAINSP